MIRHIRGNVDTRIRKLRAEDGGYDAIVLARAGLDRLELSDQITEVVSHDLMLPAPGQGALGIECRSGDEVVLAMLSKLHDLDTAAAVSAERAFLAALEAGCNTPVGSIARIAGDRLTFWGRCLSPDGTRCIETRGECARTEAADLGRRMAEETRAQGFSELQCA
jgi:hydroxymethylbilane synthase